MEEDIIDMIIRLTGYEELKDNLEINLIEEDILDSLAFIELIDELEEKYNIEIQPTQVPKETWSTVDSIVKFIEKKKDGK